MAIMARCRIPPENLCGYCRLREPGPGIWTMRSISTAHRQACCRFMSLCSLPVSAICSPIFKTGFREVMGS